VHGRRAAAAGNEAALLIMRHSPQLTRLIDALKALRESGPRARNACLSSAAGRPQRRERVGEALSAGARNRRALRPVPHVDRRYALPHLRIGGARATLLCVVESPSDVVCHLIYTVGQAQGPPTRCSKQHVVLHAYNRSIGTRRTGRGAPNTYYLMVLQNLATETV